MTLFSSLSIGSSAVNVNQFALRVVGNNIANAGTEGYVRETVQLGSLPSSMYGSFSVGNGVSISSTQQEIDRYLKDRARQAGSDFYAAEAQSGLYTRVEAIFGELSSSDLSTHFTRFFSAIQNVANRPTDQALRGVAIQEGAALADKIRDFRTKLDGVATDVASQIELTASQINETLISIKTLNREIVAAESGVTSDAGNLRSLRDGELDRLAKLVPIQVHEDPNGSVNVLVEGDFLLFNGTIQEVTTADIDDGEYVATKLIFADSQRELPTDGGKLGGLADFRDGALRDLGESLDTLAANLVYEFNRLHSSGQGLTPLTTLEGTNRAIDPTAVLTSDDAGLAFTPTNGSFEINVTDPSTGQKVTYRVDVDLDGVGTDDSLQSVVNRINTVAFGGSSVASVNAQGRVQFDATASQAFTFGNDTSGFLSAFGLNTFFTGTDARTIAVSDKLKADPRLLAVSKTGQPGDNQNALALGLFGEKTLAGLGGVSLNTYFTGIVEQIGTGSRSTANAAETLKNTKLALESENLAITGVNLDEEAIKLVTYQRAFQASAKYIQTINELLDEVIRII
jgi:flagellar hook-associated protein 1 FlgK